MPVFNFENSHMLVTGTVYHYDGKVYQVDTVLKTNAVIFDQAYEDDNPGDYHTFMIHPDFDQMNNELWKKYPDTEGALHFEYTFDDAMMPDDYLSSFAYIYLDQDNPL